MAAVKKFGVPLDLNKFEIRNAKIQSGLPTGLGAGDAGLYALDAGAELRVWNGTEWVLRATDAARIAGKEYGDILADMDARDAGVTTGYTTAVEILRQETDTRFSDAIAATAADHASIRTDFATGDNAVRTEFAAGDTAVRQEFAAADQTVTTAFQAADALIRQDFAAADVVINDRISEVDGELRSRIGEEAQDRIQSDADLRASIDEEIASRTTGDADVTAAFTAADTALRTDLNAADAAIRTEFAAADTALDASLRAYVDTLQGTASTGTTEAINALRTEVQQADSELRSDLNATDMGLRAYVDEQAGNIYMTIAGTETNFQGQLSTLETTLGNRANHTGTQSADTISDFDTAVRRSRLDQLAAPTALVDLNSQRLINVADPTADTDAANKRYVDLARQGLRQKQAVRIATAEAQVLALDGTDTEVDGVAVVAGDRVLVKDQEDMIQNGIYVVVDGGPWVRADDANVAAEVSDGAQVWVREGATNSDTSWAQVRTVADLAADEQFWVQQGKVMTYGAGLGLVFDAGNAGGAFAVNPGLGITVADTLTAIDTEVVSRKVTGLFAGGADFEVIQHNLGTRGVVVQIYQNGGDYDQIEYGIERTTENTITVRFGEAIDAASHGFVVMG